MLLCCAHSALASNRLKFKRHKTRIFVAGVPHGRRSGAPRNLKKITRAQRLSLHLPGGSQHNIFHCPDQFVFVTRRKRRRLLRLGSNQSGAHLIRFELLSCSFLPGCRKNLRPKIRTAAGRMHLSVRTTYPDVPAASSR